MKRREGQRVWAVRYWMLQRLTAVVLLPLMGWMAWSFLTVVRLPYEAALSWVIGHRLEISLWSLVIFFHAYLGLQVILEDYIHQERIRWVFLTGLRLGGVALGFFLLYCFFQLGG